MKPGDHGRYVLDNGRPARARPGVVEGRDGELLLRVGEHLIRVG